MKTVPLLRGLPIGRGSTSRQAPQVQGTVRPCKRIRVAHRRFNSHPPRPLPSLTEPFRHVRDHVCYRGHQRDVLTQILRINLVDGVGVRMVVVEVV